MFSGSGAAATRLSTLIDKITTTAPAADVFVATIIPLSGAHTQVRAFNAQIPGIVTAKPNAGGYQRSLAPRSLTTLVQAARRSGGLR